MLARPAGEVPSNPLQEVLDKCEQRRAALQLPTHPVARMAMLAGAHTAMPWVDIRSFSPPAVPPSVPDCGICLVPIGGHRSAPGRLSSITLATSIPFLSTELDPTWRHAMARFFAVAHVDFVLTDNEPLMMLWQQYQLEAMHPVPLLEPEQLRKHVPPAIDIDSFPLPPDLQELIPSTLQRTHSIVPLTAHLESGYLCVAIAGIPAATVRGEINAALRRALKLTKIVYCSAEPERIQRIVSRQQAKRVDTAQMAKVVIAAIEARGTTAERPPETFELESLLAKAEATAEGEADDATAKDVLRLILLEGFTREASDVHVSRQEDFCWVRYREDGLLFDHEMTKRFPAALARPVINRIKTLSDLDIAASRGAHQDGRFALEFDGNKYELRVCANDNAYGDHAVIRVQNATRGVPTLKNLGFHERELELLQSAKDAANGFTLVCGATGSGKSTTLYSLIDTIDSERYKVITLEDPIEIRRPGIEQMAMNPDRGITFDRALKAVLRQDPDYVVVGEMRDAATAKEALVAAQTGHVVFSTLHANSACQAPGRFMYMQGVDQFIFVSVLHTIVAQSLVRTICQNCKQEEPLDELKIKAAGFPLKWFEGVKTVARGVGCPHCRQRGFRGRTGLYEALRVTQPVREAILAKATPHALEELLNAQGGETIMRQAGHLLAKGVISLQSASELVQTVTAE